jgi:hypothetical protein
LRIWINDQGNQRLNVYSHDLQFLASFRNAANGMESADGMELSEEHNLLLVADQGNDRVLAFDLMQLQVILDWLEMASPVQEARTLTAHTDASLTGMHHPLLDGDGMFLRAEGTGSAAQIDTVLARVASQQDRRGLVVRLVETGLATGVFVGSVRVGDHTDPTTTTLGAVVGDTLRAHLAAGPWEVVEPVQRNTPPFLPLQVSPEPGSVLHEWPPQLGVLGLLDAEGQPLLVRIEARTPQGKRMQSPAFSVSDEWIEWGLGSFNVFENEQLVWRVLISDGMDTTVGPWWTTYRDELADPPNLPELTAPGDGTWQHDDQILLQWTQVLDPDPQQQADLQLEWRRTDDRRWHREPLEPTTSHLWNGPQRDGTIEWRLRVLDASGLLQLTPIRSLKLDRTWSVTLFVTDGASRSAPLTIGMRPGARDATVPGEDAKAPDAPGAPEIVSISPQSPGRNPFGPENLVDLRRPVAPTGHKRPTSFDILVRGRPRGILTLNVAEADLPQRWKLVWQDADGNERTTLPPPTPLRLHMNAQGEYRGRIVFGTATEDRDEPPLHPEDQPWQFSVEDQAVLEGRWRPGLHRHMSMLPNPLHPGVRLLPSQLDGPVNLSVFDVRGRLVRNWRGSGVDLTAQDVFGSRTLPNGIYMLQLRHGAESARRKVVWRRP